MQGTNDGSRFGLLCSVGDFGWYSCGIFRTWVPHTIEHLKFLAIQNLFWNMAEFDRVIIVGPRKLGKCDCYKFLFGKSQITHLAQPNVTNIHSQKLKPLQLPPSLWYLASHAQSRIQGHLWQKWAKKSLRNHKFWENKKTRMMEMSLDFIFFALGTWRFQLLSQL